MRRRALRARQGTSLTLGGNAPRRVMTVRVALYLFDEVEVLDFARPFEARRRRRGEAALPCPARESAHWIDEGRVATSGRGLGPFWG